MKNQVLCAIGVAVYLSLFGALIAVIVLVSDERTQMIAMNAISTALMTATLIIAVFFLKNKEKQHIYDEFEELRKKDEER